LDLLPLAPDSGTFGVEAGHQELWNQIWEEHTAQLYAYYENAYYTHNQAKSSQASQDVEEYANPVKNYDIAEHLRDLKICQDSKVFEEVVQIPEAVVQVPEAVVQVPEACSSLPAAGLLSSQCLPESGDGVISATSDPELSSHNIL